MEELRENRELKKLMKKCQNLIDLMNEVEIEFSMKEVQNLKDENRNFKSQIAYLNNKVVELEK